MLIYLVKGYMMHGTFQLMTIEMIWKARNLFPLFSTVECVFFYAYDFEIKWKKIGFLSIRQKPRIDRVNNMNSKYFTRLE